MIYLTTNTKCCGEDLNFYYIKGDDPIQDVCKLSCCSCGKSLKMKNVSKSEIYLEWEALYAHAKEPTKQEVEMQFHIEFIQHHLNLLKEILN